MRGRPLPVTAADDQSVPQVAAAAVAARGWRRRAVAAAVAAVLRRRHLRGHPQPKSGVLDFAFVLQRTPELRATLPGHMLRAVGLPLPVAAALAADDRRAV